MFLLAQSAASQPASSTAPAAVPAAAPAFDWSLWSLAPADFLHAALFLVSALALGFIILLVTRKLIHRFQLFSAVLVAIAAIALFLTSVALKPARFVDP